MARTKQNQRSANRVAVPMGATGGRTPPSKITVALFATSIIAAIWAAMMLTPFGRMAYVYFFAYSEYYMGVLCLVALSITIMIGLVATDRLVLSIRQRVLLQSAHRTTGVIAVGALGLHLWTKLMEEHIRLIDIFIPFLAPYNTLFIGLGTISGFIMVTVMWTGIVRARFVGKGKPWMWRSVHAVSYLMWPIALVHGLSAGRPGATWVTVSYVICVLFVLVGLAVRLSVSLNRRKDFSSTSTGSIKPVGSLVPTTAPSAKKRTPSRRRDAEDARVVADRGNAPAAVLETWVPAAGPTVSPVSAMPAPVSGPAYGDEYQRSSRAERYAEVDEPAPRSRQRPVDPAYVDDEMPAPRQRRAPAGERFDESTRPVSRRALEDERHRYADDEVVSAPRSRRRAAEPMIEEPEYDDPPVRSRRAIEGARSGRYAEDEPGLRPRRAADEPARSRYAEPDEPVSRARRRAAEPPMAEPGYDEVPPPRSRRYAEDEVPRQRGTGEPRRAGSHTGEIRIDPSQTGEFRLDPSQTGEFRRDQTGEFRRDQTGEFRRDQTGEFRRDPSRTGEFRMDPSRTGEFRREPRTGEFRYEDGPASPRSRPARYAEDDEVAAPRGRRDRGANVDGADSGRHSRSDFVDLAEPADPWSDVPDTNYLPADETPTLVDMASRRARRATQQDTTRGTSRGARRTKGRGADDAVDDQQYWRQLRGEAQ